MFLASSTWSCCLWISHLGPSDATANTETRVHHEGHEEREGVEQENLLARFQQSLMEGRRRFLTETRSWKSLCFVIPVPL